MAEEAFAEQIVPGTFIRVLSEGLIAPKGVAFGNVGIVGTAVAAAGAPGNAIGTTHVLGGMEDAGKLFKMQRSSGTPADTSPMGLARGLGLLFANGARTVYARGLAAGADQAAFAAAVTEVMKEEVNIVLAPELTTSNAVTALGAALEASENTGRDAIAVVGCDAATTTLIKGQVTNNDRIVFVTPAVRAPDPETGQVATLPAGFSAAAVAGLLASLAPQTSATNKVLAGVGELGTRYTYSEIKDLITPGANAGNAVVLESRGGIRVVRALTGDNGAFSQITTRRIVDYAKAGIRLVANPFVGKLNNDRVRKAMRGALDSFLTTMVIDEALTAYELDVTATRADEIAGRCVVNVVMQPTFSIDFIRVTLTLA
jgi:coenzyme F420-reducing hydrogenase delta subunit